MANRVLIIDDDETTHALVRKILSQDDIDVVCESDGTRGIMAAKHINPDLILLDVMLPGMDGFEICELLSVQAETAGTPVVFLSGAGSPADRVRGLNTGATDYIVKPFDGEELRARVRVAMRYKALLELESRRAMRDGMTGLWNRIYFDNRLAAESAASLRHSRPLACMMIDLDHFKHINDTHGHAVGDVALREVARLLAERCRTEDVVCRYGGEEFVILCPSTTAVAAGILADRLRINISELVLQGSHGPLQVTCSIGIADGMSGSALCNAADIALYHAKRTGRNRVCLASDLQKTPAAA